MLWTSLAMTTAIDSLREHLSRPRKPAGLVVDWGLFVLFLVGVAYLLFKSYQVTNYPGFDFRYAWLAGEAWLRGINPYGPEFHELGKELITSGYVPLMWVYPPNWYFPAVLVAVADLETSFFLTNIVNVVLFVASSALLTAACPPLRFENAPRNPAFDLLRRHLRSPWNVFFLHVFAVATLQATAITISVGQPSILVYFGICLLIYGLVRDRQLSAVLGLAIVFLKPQLAVVIFVALVMTPAYRMLVAKAIGVSAMVSLPAFVVTPAAAFEFFTNLTRYDGITSANWPQSTTGLRNLVWEISNFDPGNVACMLAAIIIMIGLYFPLVRGRRESGGTELMMLASAVTIGIAPLHVYDLVLVGVLLFALARSRPVDMAVGVLGAMLLWRAGDIAKLTGFYGSGTEHFEGSRLATIGTMLIMIAVFETVRRRRPSDAP